MDMVKNIDLTFYIFKMALILVVVVVVVVVVRQGVSCVHCLHNTIWDWGMNQNTKKKEKKTAVFSSSFLFSVNIIGHTKTIATTAASECKLRQLC